MADFKFNNKEEFIRWVSEYNAGRFEKGTVYLENFSGYNIHLYDIKDLNIHVSERSDHSSISLFSGEYGEISILGSVNLEVNQSKVNTIHTKQMLNIDDCRINTLEHKGTGLTVKKSIITNLYINSIHSLDLQIYDIKNCEIRNHKGIGNSKFSLKFLEKSVFIIKHCVFNEKVNFKYCDFSFTTLYSYNSTFSMKSYRGIKWFKKIRMITEDDKLTKIIPRDECRQLKNIAKEIENSIDEDYFRAFELHALMQELKLFSYKFDTKVTLVLNNLSNRFERSWIIPLVWILVIGFIFFIPSFYSTLLWQEHKKCLNDYLSYYWLFINPIHSFYLFGEKYSTGLTYFLDTFHRVFNYYLIYQFVAAFRKFRRA